MNITDSIIYQQKKTISIKKYKSNLTSNMP